MTCFVITVTEVSNRVARIKRGYQPTAALQRSDICCKSFVISSENEVINICV
jgi:hypothetical protein